MGAKGGKTGMALHLYEHNVRAYAAAAAMLDRYGKAAVVHPTGTGKSYIAFKLIEDHPDAACFCCPETGHSRDRAVRPHRERDCFFAEIFTYSSTKMCGN